MFINLNKNAVFVNNYKHKTEILRGKDIKKGLKE